MSAVAGIWVPWTPEEVVRVLDGVDVSWCVAGGWALELWDSRLARAHADIEITMPRSQFAVLRQRLEQRFPLYAVGGGAWTPLCPGDPFPRDVNQCWVRDGDIWRLDVMLDPGDEASWVFRRDPRIFAPRDRAVRRSASGLRYLAPEVVLLFKAKSDRPKDKADFEAALPILDQAARQWLADALKISSPGHPWIARLSA